MTKSEITLIAKQHNETMIKEYSEEISQCVNGSWMYDACFTYPEYTVHNPQMKFVYEPLTTSGALFNLPAEGVGRVALLNFASYKNPGGKFLSGSMAQEEALCHESYLYNILSADKFSEYYSWNKLHLDRGLYTNRAIYSPNVRFFSDDNQTRFCDVITCAAPNKSLGLRYKSFSSEENTQALRSRIKFVLDIAKHQGVNTLILGAFGAGVFKQDAQEVAEIFKEYLTTTHDCFDTVIFAVPYHSGGTSTQRRNGEVFQSVFSQSEN